MMKRVKRWVFRQAMKLTLLTTPSYVECDTHKEELTTSARGLASLLQSQEAS